MSAQIVVSLAVALIVWLVLLKPDRQIPDADSGVNRVSESGSLSLPLVLEMLIVLIRHGASIPAALRTLGLLIDGEFGQGLLALTQALQRGCSWQEAWSDVSTQGRYAQVFAQIEHALHDSWAYGQSPIASLQALIERNRAVQHEEIEQQAARLSIRLLLPTGLCFLPAFILIGVIPAIGSMVV